MAGRSALATNETLEQSAKKTKGFSSPRLKPF